LLYVKRALLATVIAVVMGAAQAAPVGEGATTASVPGEKIDNGLGSLPHFSKWTETWVYATPAESIDNGLGSLPPYSLWNEPWLYAYPAAKIDSGLGEISPRAPALERAVAHAR
jgi:hypothetical protein